MDTINKAARALESESYLLLEICTRNQHWQEFNEQRKLSAFQVHLEESGVIVRQEHHRGPSEEGNREGGR